MGWASASALPAARSWRGTRPAGEVPALRKRASRGGRRVGEAHSSAWFSSSVAFSSSAGASSCRQQAAAVRPEEPPENRPCVAQAFSSTPARWARRRRRRYRRRRLLRQDCPPQPPWRPPPPPSSPPPQQWHPAHIRDKGFSRRDRKKWWREANILRSTQQHRRPAAQPTSMTFLGAQAFSRTSAASASLFPTTTLQG